MSDASGKTYTARWIFPVAGPPLPHGTITIHAGRIFTVEPRGTRRAEVDFGNAAILPGFCNAHTHLDLSGARGVCPPAPDFTHWLRRVIAFRSTRPPEQVQMDIAEGLKECLRCGTTLVGDIASGGASWDLLAQAHCRAIVFREVLGLTEERALLNWQSAQDWLKQHPANDRVRAGLSPHAPYSVRMELYRLIAGANVPVATHLAETQAELDLLRRQAGPFVAFLKELNVWDPTGLSADPLDIVRLFPKGLFVHGNYLDGQTRFLPGQILAICPRTHAAFGHPRHPFPAMLQSGVRIALGTDSLASNPDLDILAEARFLRKHYPEVEPAVLLRILTLSGAEALGLHPLTGSLSAGKSADLVVLPLPDAEPADAHDLILDSTTTVQRVMFRGEWVHV